MLGVKRGEGPTLCFTGFRDKDLDALKEISNTAIKVRLLWNAKGSYGRGVYLAMVLGPTG
jgi:hypothetical protein